MHTRFHADDCGATPRSTAAIIDCWRAGAIDGFSILGNGLALDETTAALAAEPERPAFIAAHLNLSEGPPSAEPSEVPDLLGADGLLRHSFGSLARALVSPGRKRLLAQVEREWDAQLRVVQRVVAPRSIAALDGHQHLHMLPGLFDLACSLAAAHGAPGVRLSSEPVYVVRGSGDWRKPFYWKNLLKNAVLNALAVGGRRVARRHGRTIDSAVIGVLYSGAMTVPSIEQGIDAARARGHDSLEVIVHVGRAAEEEKARWSNAPSIGDFYLDEGRAVEDRAVRAVNGLRKP